MAQVTQAAHEASCMYPLYMGHDTEHIDQLIELGAVEFACMKIGDGVMMTEMVHFFNKDGDEVGYTCNFPWVGKATTFDPPRKWGAEFKKPMKFRSWHARLKSWAESR